MTKNNNVISFLEKEKQTPSQKKKEKMNQDGNQNRPHYAGLRRAISGLTNFQKINYLIDQVDRARGQRDFYKERLGESEDQNRVLREQVEEGDRNKENLKSEARERIGRRDRTIERQRGELIHERSRVVLAERQLRNGMDEFRRRSLGRAESFVEILNELMGDWDLGMRFEVDWEEGQALDILWDMVEGETAGAPMLEELPESDDDGELEELPGSDLE